MRTLKKRVVITSVAFVTILGMQALYHTTTAEARTVTTHKSLLVLNGKEPAKGFSTNHKQTTNKVTNKQNDSQRTRFYKETTKSYAQSKTLKIDLSEINTRAISDKKKLAEIRKLITYAGKYQGVPYQFGGVTPKGFDCSGYLNYVFKNSLGMSLPRSADQQYKVGKDVKRAKLQPGDLVFFSTYEKGVSHSGIYVGHDKFISATTSRGVAVADMSSGYWHERYIGAKRIL